MKPCQHCTTWQAVTGCKTPEEAKVWLAELNKDLKEIERIIEEDDSL